MSGGAPLALVTVLVTGPIGGHCSGDTPAENTVAVCYTISQMPKMAPVKTSRGRNLVTTLSLKKERYPYHTKLCKSLHRQICAK